ncbi:hypothetical protein FO519_005568 [Halicephalobus sp. NKZ332]|nr:hypothetical protein FO519_005568 [Halicephalobus sp. NKZ332]
MLPEPQSPRTGLALSDLQSTSAGGTYAIGGGGISGLAISSSHGSGSWSTRGVGGIGAGIFDNSGPSSSSSGASGSSKESNNGNIFRTQIFIFKALLVSFLLMPENAAADGLPPCDEIPKLLCCTGRVLEKCLAGCVDYITQKCPHKLQKFDKIPTSTASPEVEEEKPQEPVRRKEIHQASIPEGPALRSERPRAESGGPRPSGGRPRQFAELQEGFIEQPSPVSGGTSGRTRSGGDYDKLNPNYPVTEVTDSDLSPECGTSKSKPPFSPCLSRKVVDDLFLSCCRQHVPSNCHALCSYEHREHVAAETLIAAVQSDGCDLRHLSSILYCANQNRDNRECCEHLSLSSSALGVGDRCLRMCNIAQSGQSIGTVEKNDLVCLSNWNVIMYCARAGLRTIN